MKPTDPDETKDVHKRRTDIGTSRLNLTDSSFLATQN